MGDNGTRRSMVSLQVTGAAASLHGARLSGSSLDSFSGIYEEGMKTVLRQVACTQLKYEFEHEGIGYEKSVAQSKKVAALFDQLQHNLPEELIDQLVELQSQVGYLELEGMDAGYIAGFLAGYRFLQEVNPES